MRRLIAALAVLCVAACVTATQPRLISGASPPPSEDAVVLLVQPDVALNILGAAGQQEPRADWSASAQANIAASIKANLEAKRHPSIAFDPEAASEGRAGQLIRLHEAVGASIAAFSYGQPLPTHPRDTFQWTLGPGAHDIAPQTEARYALFVTGRGSYASSARVAAMIGMAILGVGVPLGSQQVFASLVDLQTGEIVWFNVALASPDADMRSPQGAQRLIDKMMESCPL